MSTQASAPMKSRHFQEKKKIFGSSCEELCAHLDTHLHNTTHTSIQAVCKVKGSTQADDNVVFLLQSFYGRCASAVKAEGMHWGLVN